MKFTAQSLSGEMKEYSFTIHTYPESEEFYSASGSNEMAPPSLMSPFDDSDDDAASDSEIQQSENDEMMTDVVDQPAASVIASVGSALPDARDGILEDVPAELRILPGI